MQQNERRPRAGAQIPHPCAIYLHPALFHPIASPRCGGRRLLLQFIHGNFQLWDNSLLSTGVYLRERLCRFTLGSFGSPFFIKAFGRAGLLVFTHPS